MATDQFDRPTFAPPEVAVKLHDLERMTNRDKCPCIHDVMKRAFD